MPEHLYTKVGHMYCAAGFLTSVMHKCLRNIYPNDWASRKPPLSYSLKWHPGKSEKKGGQPKTGGRPERLGTQKKSSHADVHAYMHTIKPTSHTDIFGALAATLACAYGTRFVAAPHSAEHDMWPAKAGRRVERHTAWSTHVLSWNGKATPPTLVVVPNSLVGVRRDNSAPGRHSINISRRFNIGFAPRLNKPTQR